MLVAVGNKRWARCLERACAAPESTCTIPAKL